MIRQFCQFRFLLAFGGLVLLTACGFESILSQPSAPSGSPTTLIYDAPVSLTIRNGSLLPGTSIAYGGKTATGAAKIMLAGLEAPKKTGDSLDWEGSPTTNVKVKLTTRVLNFDDSSVTVAGAAHVELTNISVQPGGSSGAPLMEFSAPVTYTLTKNQTLPGSNVGFVGMTTDGAQFSGVAGVPYRKQLDSLEYSGRILPKVFLRLDLRVISFSNEGAVLGGTANIKIESQ